MSDTKLRYRTKEPGVCTQMFRGLLMLVNLVMAVGSVVVLAFAGWAQAQSTKDLTTVCNSCQSIVIFGLALFATLFVFSVIGFLALYKRNSCLLCIYGLYLVIFFLGALAITIVFVLVKSGKFDDRLQQAWNEAVTINSASLCKLELDLSCSGWNSLCNETAGSYVNSTVCPVCAPDQNATMRFNQTCFSVLTNQLDKYYDPLTIIGFTLVGLALVSLLVACKVRKTDDDDDEGGKYTRM